MESGISGHYSSPTSRSALRLTRPPAHPSQEVIRLAGSPSAFLLKLSPFVRSRPSLPPSLQDLSLLCSSLKIGPLPELHVGMMSRGQPAFKFRIAVTPPTHDTCRRVKGTLFEVRRMGIAGETLDLSFCCASFLRRTGHGMQSNDTAPRVSKDSGFPVPTHFPLVRTYVSSF